MGIFVSPQKTIECVFLALFFTAAVCIITFKHVGVLQNAGYRNSKYCRWLNPKDNFALARLYIVSLLCLISSAVLALCFSFAGKGAALCSLAAYIIFYSAYFVADRKIALRSTAKVTPRFLRLYAVYALVTAIFCYAAVTLINFADYVLNSALFTTLKYVLFAPLPLLSIPLLLLSNLISKLFETPHNRRFIKKAREKLASSDIVVIGVTGSYGKTSVKNILYNMLSQKLRVLATPQSYNTPIGIAMTVNGANLGDYDVFIAEMGARHEGDIAELCSVCRPDYSVITGICGQHLQTFGTFDAVVRAKGEIISGTRHATFVAADCYDLYAANPRVERCAGAENIVCSPEGVEFDLHLSSPVRCKSKLLGAHAAHNIALAARVALAMGLSDEEILAGIEKVDFIEHRLQLIKSGGINIIDDGYNSNVRGARAALEVLKLFDGGKVVVTPGLVELGVLEEKENYALGKLLVGFDRVILVGETLCVPVKYGYLENGGDPEKLSVVPTLFHAQEKLKGMLGAGDTVLFLNDVPDVY